MSGMTSKKGTLLLIELAIMLLAVAVAAAICLVGLVKADGLSKETAAIDNAYALAQNIAEIYKSLDGDLIKLAEKLGGEYKNDILTVETNGFILTVKKEDTSPLLLGAKIEVALEEKTLASLSVRTQEVAYE